jgi:non-heme chloroperoxidase
MRGHTIPTYAQDLHAFIQDKELEDVTLVGWSMGAFVMWDYMRQFGTGNFKASVVVDEAASDFKWPGYDHGFAERVEDVAGFVTAIQSDWHGFIREFSISMFASHPSEEDARWMFDEISRVPPVIASTILVDEIFCDYRDFLTTVDLPILICGGRATCPEITVEVLEDVQARVKNSKLVIFEKSGHCPFLEETEKFNKTVDDFLKGLD